MPEYLSFDLFAGVLTVFAAIMLRARAQRPRLPAWKLGLAGIAGACATPPLIAALAAIWQAVPALPPALLPTAEKLYLGAWTAVLALAISHRTGRPPRLSLRTGLLIGLVVALLLPVVLERLTGQIQRSSLLADLNRCTRAVVGQGRPYQVSNVCDEPIAVGLCLPGEINPAPCARSRILLPGEMAQFDPGEARLSSLPSNPDGFTIVACRPPARPSRIRKNTGRGYDGVCLPPG